MTQNTSKWKIFPNPYTEAILIKNNVFGRESLMEDAIGVIKINSHKF